MLTTILLAATLTLTHRHAVAASSRLHATPHHQQQHYYVKSSRHRTTAPTATDAPETPPTPPLVGGTPVAIGDAIVCRDDASQAWWRATVRDTRGSQILVHWLGCDDSWDEWREAASPSVALPADMGESPRAAFQADEAEIEAGNDEEILAALRQKRWEGNMRWQLQVFANSQLGEWRGQCKIFAPTLHTSALDGDSTRIVEGATASCSSSAVVLNDGEIEWAETVDDDALGLSATLRAESFDRGEGAFCVGTAYTLSAGDAGGSLLFEIGLREGPHRVRCKFLYAAPQDGVHALERVAVISEAEGSAAPAPSASAGAGLYDPPPGDRRTYCSLYVEGGLTLVFPEKLSLDQSGFVSVDWIAGEMRYQADRKFAAPGRPVSSFEVTEIRTEDADTYQLPNTG